MDEIVSLSLDDKIIPLFQMDGLAVRIITAWIVNVKNNFHAQKRMIAEYLYHVPRKSLLSEPPFICSAISYIEHLISGGGPF